MQQTSAQPVFFSGPLNRLEGYSREQVYGCITTECISKHTGAVIFVRKGSVAEGEKKFCRKIQREMTKQGTMATWQGPRSLQQGLSDCGPAEATGPHDMTKGSGQRLNVQMETSDEWSPSGVRTGTGAVQCIYQ